MNDKKKVKTVWTSNEENKLIKLISEKNTLSQISDKLKKNQKDIRHKLKKNVIKMYNENKTKDEIKHALKLLSDNEITKVINHLDKKKSSEKIRSKLKNENLSELGIENNKQEAKSSKSNKSNKSNKSDKVKTNPNHKSNKNDNLLKKIDINDFNTIVSLLTDINLKLELIMKGKVLNNNITDKSSNSSKLNTIQNVMMQTNDNDNGNGNENGLRQMESYTTSYVSSGEDTDNIINMIDTNKINNYNSYKKK